MTDYPPQVYDHLERVVVNGWRTLENNDPESLRLQAVCLEEGLTERVEREYKEAPSQGSDGKWHRITIPYGDYCITPKGHLALLRYRDGSKQIADSEWYTQADVVRGLGWYEKDKNTGQQRVSRLCKDGTLRTNNKEGRDCRVDPASVMAYCKREGVAWNDNVTPT